MSQSRRKVRPEAGVGNSSIVDRVEVRAARIIGKETARSGRVPEKTNRQLHDLVTTSRYRLTGQAPSHPPALAPSLGRRTAPFLPISNQLVPENHISRQQAIGLSRHRHRHRSESETRTDL